jgi:hypothetical protein
MIGSAFRQIAPGRVGVAGREPNGGKWIKDLKVWVCLPMAPVLPLTDSRGSGQSPPFGQLSGKQRLACGG